MLIAAINWLDKNRHKKTSVGFLVLIEVLLCVIVFLVFKSLYPYAKIVLPNIKGVVFIYYSLGLGVLGLLIFFLLWLIFRRRPSFKNKNIGILFAPYNADGGFSEDIIKVFNRVKEDLLSRTGTKNIICKKLPFNHIVRNNDDAKILLKRTKAFLIIHGRFDEGKIDGKKVKGFLNINFLVRGLAGLTDIDKAFIIGNIKGRGFRFFDENSFKDENIVIENINDISLYLISIAFILHKEPDKAIEILIGIKNKYVSSSNRNLQRFKRGVSTHLSRCYELKLWKLEPAVMKKITSQDANKTVEKFKKLAVDALLVSNDNISYHIRMAMYYFHYKEIKKAKDQLGKIKSTSSNDAINRKNISLAFLYMWDQNYENSLKFYRRSKSWIKKMYSNNDSSSNIDDIIVFIQTVLNFNPDKFYLFFSLGFINEHCGDISEALKNYKVFIQKNGGIDNKLKSHAENYIKSNGLDCPKSRIN